MRRSVDDSVATKAQVNVTRAFLRGFVFDMSDYPESDSLSRFLDSLAKDQFFEIPSPSQGEKLHALGFTREDWNDAYEKYKKDYRETDSKGTDNTPKLPKTLTFYPSFDQSRNAGQIFSANSFQSLEENKVTDDETFLSNLLFIHYHFPSENKKIRDEMLAEVTKAKTKDGGRINLSAIFRGRVDELLAPYHTRDQTASSFSPGNWLVKRSLELDTPLEEKSHKDTPIQQLRAHRADLHDLVMLSNGDVEAGLLQLRLLISSSSKRLYSKVVRINDIGATQKEQDAFVDNILNNKNHGINSFKPTGAFDVPIIFCNGRHYVMATLSYNEDHHITRIKLKDSYIQETTNALAVARELCDRLARRVNTTTTTIVPNVTIEPEVTIEPSTVNQIGLCCGDIALYHAAKEVEVETKAYPEIAKIVNGKPSYVTDENSGRILRKETYLLAAQHLGNRKDVDTGNWGSFDDYKKIIDEEAKKRITTPSKTPPDLKTTPPSLPAQQKKSASKKQKGEFTPVVDKTESNSKTSSSNESSASAQPTSAKEQIKGKNGEVIANIDPENLNTEVTMQSGDPDLEENMNKVLKRLYEVISESSKTVRRHGKKIVLDITSADHSMSEENLQKLRSIADKSENFITAEQVEQLKRQRPSQRFNLAPRGTGGTTPAVPNPPLEEDSSNALRL